MYYPNECYESHFCPQGKEDVHIGKWESSNCFTDETVWWESISQYCRNKHTHPHASWEWSWDEDLLWWNYEIYSVHTSPLKWKRAYWSWKAVNSSFYCFVVSVTAWSSSGRSETHLSENVEEALCLVQVTERTVVKRYGKRRHCHGRLGRNLATETPFSWLHTTQILGLLNMEWCWC